MSESTNSAETYESPANINSNLTAEACGKDVIEATLQKLIELSTTFYGNNVIELLDYLIADDGPQVADVLKHLELDPEQTLVSIQQSANKTIEHIILDYIHSEVGIQAGQQIVFTRIRGGHKEYDLDFEYFVDKFSNQMLLVASKFDMSKSDSIAANLDKLGSNNLSETVIHLVRDIFRINLSMKDLLYFFNICVDPSGEVTPGVLVDFEKFLEKNFAESLKAFLVRIMNSNYAIQIRNSTAPNIALSNDSDSEMLLSKLLVLVDKSLLNLDESVGFYLNKINARFDLRPIHWGCIQPVALGDPLAIDVINASDEVMEQLLEKIISNNSTEQINAIKGNETIVVDEFAGVKCQPLCDELAFLRTKIQTSVRA